ncbi:MULTISPECIES: hypothetical protein [Pseudomonas]|uniref:Uncharacterized protein n=1 Tax=Pseudomonas vlassakiae TaxID=485888 RepID=A0A923GJK4_9PSED|nr:MULTISPECIES: hypothetical protein [Pseudomonas]MBH3410676.1 hypothetical protein [Pseudomonas putida]MBV4541782.1 hypothetical protein [Pseudomonas vlassakiae]
MYGFAKDLKIEGILGEEIRQIRMGRYDVQLLFGSGSCIAVQSLIEVFHGDELIATWDEDVNWTSSNFQRLLNVSVTSYSVIDERVLEICLSEEFRLRLHDNSEQFESVQIYPQHIVI